MLFLHYGWRFGADFLIRTSDSQRVHAVLEHPTADSQQVGGMGLDVVRSLEGIQDNFPLKFHNGFFKRQSPGERVVTKRGGPGVVLENGRKMFGCDDVRSLGPNERLFDDILHLPNIAWPGIAGQKIDGIFGEILGGPTVFFDTFGQKMFGEERDILTALPEGGANTAQ